MFLKFKITLFFMHFIETKLTILFYIYLCNFIAIMVERNVSEFRKIKEFLVVVDAKT